MSQVAPFDPETLRAKVAGSSFYAGMRILPEAEREAMFAVYGFCRVVDDIADGDGAGWEGASREARAAGLAQWRGWIGALYHGGDVGQAAFLAPAVARFGLLEADFLEVIAGMEMDVAADIRWPAFETLDLYCDRVASAVGRLSVNVFGMERAPGVVLAHHLGRALQFTNILRDIDEDAGIGRVYLPAEALAAGGIAPTTPQALLAEPGLDAAARWLAPLAQKHFAEAAALLATRPKGHLVAPRLMEAAYSRLLVKMLAQGWAAPRVRVKVSKPLLALSALRFWLLG